LAGCSLLRHVRRHVPVAHFPYESSRVIAFVGAQSKPAYCGNVLVENRNGLVVDTLVLRSPAIRPAISRAASRCQPCFRIGGGGMRVVAALFPVEINAWIAGVLQWRCAILIFALKTLPTRPSLDQCTVHAEMFIRQQVVGTCLFQHLCEELLGDIAIQQPVAILAEHGGDPYWLVQCSDPRTSGTAGCIPVAHQHRLTANLVQHLQ